MFIISEFQRHKLQINTSVQTFYNVYGKMGCENNLTSGALQIGFSVITMLLLTLLCI